jgi:hypothetical protein
MHRAVVDAVVELHSEQRCKCGTFTVRRLLLLAEAVPLAKALPLLPLHSCIHMVIVVMHMHAYLHW